MDLIDLLPDYYRGNSTMEKLQSILTADINMMSNNLNETINQCFIETATNLLSRYETLYGLQVDVTKPYTFRRERIKAKIRGIGTVTATMIKNVAESFTNGQIEVIEHNSESSFEVKFTNIIGIPPNFDDLEAALELIKPAHLALIYAYSYLLIKDIEGVMTLGDLETQTLDKFAF